MKSLLLLTASGPLLILTSHQSLDDQKLLGVLRQKGIGKFVAFEVPPGARQRALRRALSRGRKQSARDR